MPRPRGSLLSLAAVGLLATLTGCDPAAEPPPTASPSASAEALYSTEEEALAAAEAAYAQYQRVLTALGESAGVAVEELPDVATNPALQLDLEAAAELAETGTMITGLVGIESVEVQSISRTRVQAYICADYSELERVVPNEDPSPLAVDGELVPLEVSFKFEDGQLKVERQSRWSGTSFC